MATALLTIANALARMQGTAPVRPPVGLGLAAAAAAVGRALPVGRALRPAGQATTVKGGAR